MQVKIEAFAAIPYLDIAALSGRILCSTTFFTNKKWECWVPVAEPLGFLPMQLVDVAEGAYFGDTPARPDDLYLRALDIIGQSICNAATGKPFTGIWDDVYNLAASLAKLDFIAASHSSLGDQTRRMVVTEVEYLAIQCRSIFDYVQKILKAQWANVQFYDGSKPKQKFPESFGEMVMDAKIPRTSDVIAAKYLIPLLLANAYGQHATFFSYLKTMRDSIVHSAGPTPALFVTDEGIYIQKSLWPFSKFTNWRPEEILANDLVPLKPAVEAMVYRTLMAVEELVRVLAQIIQLMPPVCPGHRLFLRCTSSVTLASALVDAEARYTEC